MEYYITNTTDTSIRLIAPSQGVITLSPNYVTFSELGLSYFDQKTQKITIVSWSDFKDLIDLSNKVKALDSNNKNKIAEIIANNPPQGRFENLEIDEFTDEIKPR